MRSSVSDIKRSRKEALFFKTISSLFMKIGLDDPALRDLFINKVQLSPSGASCTVYFYIPGGQQAFDEKLAIMKLYKPSLRKAIADLIPGRYTPELIFKYDHSYEKQRKIEALLDSLPEQKTSDESDGSDGEE